MIAFAIVIGSEGRYRRCARRGIQGLAESTAVVVEKRGQSSIARAYNDVLDELAGRDDLEALVLLHDDTEIRDPAFTGKLRELFADPAVAVVGAIGATRVSSLAWWDGEGFGRINESRGTIDFGGGTHEVDAVDGCLMALSPRSVRELRFDESVAPGFHGYDLDICFEARRRGHKVMVCDIDVFHHTKGGYGDRRAWLRADAAWRRKWIRGEPRIARARHRIQRAKLRLKRPQGDLAKT